MPFKVYRKTQTFQNITCNERLAKLLLKPIITASDLIDVIYFIKSFRKRKNSRKNSNVCRLKKKRNSDEVHCNYNIFEFLYFNLRKLKLESMIRAL